MKTIITAILLSQSLLWFTNCITAQDTIIKKNGEQILAKVVEVSTSEIKYVLPDNEEGLSTSIENDMILSVHYKNGMHDNFGSDEMNSQEAVSFVEEMPIFIGGEAARVKFLQEHIKYPKYERKHGISGTCYLTFVVEKDGSITDVKVLRGVPNGKGIDAESIRVTKLMPKWTPGKLQNRLVRVQFNMAIKYTLNDIGR